MTKAIAKEFQSLTLAERVELVGDLWEQIAAEPGELPVPDWQIKELERRRRLYRSDPSRGIPWAQVSPSLHPKRKAKGLPDSHGSLNLKNDD